jgi:hypothetical protein
MGFGKTNPNFISENKVLHFCDGRKSEPITALIAFHGAVYLASCWFPDNVG